MSMKSASRMSARSTSGKPSRAANRSKFPPGQYTIHQPSECSQVLKNRPIHLKRCTFDGKEIVYAMEKQGFRKLLVPSKEPTARPKIITTSEFSDLVKRSYNPTEEEREAALAAAEHEKDRLLRESMARKEAIRRMDLRRNQNKQQGRLSEIEEEARQRTMHLLERARILKLEQEEEIKMCNKLILETKCRAIRDAQIAEKRLLEREHEVEEQRMNELMEKERLNALKADELKEKERAEQQHLFAHELKEQIQANEEERLIAYERKREESKLINMNNIVQQEAELAKSKLCEEERQRNRRQLIECNEQLKHFKAMQKEEERIMDVRIREFQKEKAKRKAMLEEKVRQEHLRKEREKERLAEQALQAQDLQAQIDELNASRVQEEVEREWRRKEKEEAVKRAEDLKELRSARAEQINLKIQMQAMEIVREKREFERILALQKEAFCREEKEREKKRRQALMLRNAILKQVNEKEKEKITSRQKHFEEGLAIRAGTEQRNRQLREAMERKCLEMRENHVPDTYISEVKRMIEHIK